MEYQLLITLLPLLVVLGLPWWQLLPVPVIAVPTAGSPSPVALIYAVMLALIAKIPLGSPALGQVVDANS
jgi:hypothetical protein